MVLIQSYKRLLSKIFLSGNIIILIIPTVNKYIRNKNPQKRKLLGERPDTVTVI